MKKLLILALLGVSLSASVQARDTEMLIPARVVFSSPDAKPIAANAVRDAIITAGAKQGWVVRGDAADKVTLAIIVRSKHEAVVDVNFDATGFQLAYVSSHNLNYEETFSGKRIHPNFNKWLLLLANDISAELVKLR